MHNYELGYMVLLEGVAFRGDNLEAPRGNAEERDFGWGWSSWILPYLEQKAIYDSIDFDVRIPDEPNRDLVSKPVPVALCPDANQTFSHLKIGNPLFQEDFMMHDPGMALTNYAVCAGSFKGSGSWDSPRAEVNGVYGEESRTAFSDIEDGTSNTIMAGEVVYYGNGIASTGLGEFLPDPRWYGSFTPKFGTARVSASQFRTGRSVINLASSEAAFTRRNAFASSHSGGANMLFADASVHFVQETIESTRTTFEDFSNGAVLGALQRLTGRNDGLVVENFQKVSFWFPENRSRGCF